MSSQATSNVPEPFDGNNFRDWGFRMKCYLTDEGLLDIVEPITDDEVALDSSDNTRALAAINGSCGESVLSEIEGTSSAKALWDTLEERYDRQSEDEADAGGEENDADAEENGADGEENDADAVAEEYGDDGEENGAGGEENDAVADAEENSADGEENDADVDGGRGGLRAFFEILADAVETDTDEETGDDNLEYIELLKHVQRGDWDATYNFLKENPRALNAKIMFWGKTALHFAVLAGYDHIAVKLVQLMFKRDLRIRGNADGLTALAETAVLGNYHVAKCMVRKNRNLVSIPAYDERIPVVMAFQFGHKELARYLYKSTPQEKFTPPQGRYGATVFTEAIYNEILDVAMDLVRRHPTLALTRDMQRLSPLYALASMPSAFSSPNRLVFWKRWIISCIPIDDTLLDIQSIEEQTNVSAPTLMQQLVSNVLKLLGPEHLHEMKLVHDQSRELRHRMSEQILISRRGKRGMVIEAFIRAIKEGNFEFVYEMGKKNPDLIWGGDGRGSIFHCAVVYRQAKIFSLIYGLAAKNVLSNIPDSHGNKLLHMAAIIDPCARLNSIAGAPLQMQRELQWFEEVESIVLPKIAEARNGEGLTARELFTKNHSSLVEKGEKWMKDSATCSSVVCGIILTITVGAAYIVLGGEDKNKGLPNFFHKKLFKPFIISDAISFFSALCSLITFSGILTSRYAESDFLKSLPTKMIMGLSTLLISIAALMIAFNTSLILLLHGESWITIPVICLASIPVILFISWHLPLLFEMVNSTYGPSIFDRKMKRWY